MGLKIRHFITVFFVMAASLSLSGCLWAGFSDLVSPTRQALATSLSPEQALTATSQAFFLQLTATKRSSWTDTPQPVHIGTLEPMPPTATLEPSSTATLELLPSDTQQPALLPSGTLTVALYDDFSTNTGWWENSTQDYSIRLSDGGYRIAVKIARTPIWSTRARQLKDVYLGVDATQMAGPEDGYYGLICRQQEGGSYYALVVSSDGSYGIAKSNRGQIEFLQEGTGQTATINPSGTLNRISAECIGDTLALTVNGEKLLEVVDQDLTSGNIGVIVGNRAASGTDVLFDNFGAVLP